MKAIPKFGNMLQDLQRLRISAPATAFAIATEMAALSAKLGKSEGIIPKKTGNLRSTARVEKDENSVAFVTGGITGKPARAGVKAVYVNYPVFVNNGTSKQSPQFFMEKSVAAANVRSGAEYSRQIRQWLRKA